MLCESSRNSRPLKQSTLPHPLTNIRDAEPRRQPFTLAYPSNIPFPINAYAPTHPWRRAHRLL